MPKHLLIIADAFPPAFAPRIGNLCKFLHHFDCTVVTTEGGATHWAIDLPQSVTVHRISLTSQSALLNRLYQFGDYAFSLSDRRLYRKTCRLLKGQTFDVVLCASFYIFPLLCGQNMARHLQVPLVIDLRDIVEQYAKPAGMEKVTHFFKLRWLNRLRRNRILRSADVVTTVSPWHVEELQKHHPCVKLIYNGYDASVFFPQVVQTDKFVLTYTGRLLGQNYQNPLLFFKALQALCEDTAFREKVCVRWFIGRESTLQVAQFTKQYALEDISEIHSTVPAQSVPTLLNESAIVLVFTEESTPMGPHGVMTTKFFEALGCEKPILCVPSDEGCLAETIRETNAGIASSDIEEVKAFILDKYHEWQKYGYTHQAVVDKERFSRQHQAEQFEQLFLSLINK